jgi:hypothetical protein
MEVNACILITHMIYLLPKQSLGYQRHSFRLLLLLYTQLVSFNQFNHSIIHIHGHELQYTNIHGAFPLLLSPLASSPFSPFVLPSTYLEPS